MEIRGKEIADYTLAELLMIHWEDDQGANGDPSFSDMRLDCAEINAVNDEIATRRAKMHQPPSMCDYSNGAVWYHFGLSYASWLVIPRRTLCSMPLVWQTEFVGLLNQLHDYMPNWATPGNLYVTARGENGKWAPLSDEFAYRHAAPIPPVNEAKG